MVRAGGCRVSCLAHTGMNKLLWRAVGQEIDHNIMFANMHVCGCAFFQVRSFSGMDRCAEMIHIRLLLTGLVAISRRIARVSTGAPMSGGSRNRTPLVGNTGGVCPVLYATNHPAPGRRVRETMRKAQADDGAATVIAAHQLHAHIGIAGERPKPASIAGLIDDAQDRRVRWIRFKFSLHSGEVSPT